MSANQQRILIRGGRLIDPANNIDGPHDLLIEHGRVAAVGTKLAVDAQSTQTIDASGLLVAPGLVDIHVHLREPGQSYKETIATGTAAATAGGFTTVAAMPNTIPVNDSVQITRWMQAPERGARARVYPIAAATLGSMGEALTDYGALRDAGAVAVSDDGKPILGNETMRAVLRDAHLSTRNALDHVRGARRSGLRVTCEVTPHHFVLTEDAVGEFDTHAKMNPPLRSADDRDAMIEGLLDGTIDAIATDHAPHAAHEKEQEFERAPNGITGLETSLGLSLSVLHRRHGMPLPQVIAQLQPHQL